jgi:AcrR family transcriptional regulator
MEGRRARLRANLLAEIRTAALDQLRRTGAASLSLREVARAAGISPSGLYRYVDGRDELLELLISDGFESFGEAIASAIRAAGDDPVTRMETVAIAYRRWALDNVDQFGLILGTPVTGFRARVDGPTNASIRRFAGPMIRVVADAYATGRQVGAADEVTTADLSLFDPMTGGLPASLSDVVVRSWARVHGLVALESFGHLVWSGTDVEELLRIEARSIAAELVLANTSPDRCEDSVESDR